MAYPEEYEKYHIAVIGMLFLRLIAICIPIYLIVVFFNSSFEGGERWVFMLLFKLVMVIEPFGSFFRF